MVEYFNGLLFYLSPVSNRHFTGSFSQHQCYKKIPPIELGGYTFYHVRTSFVYQLPRTSTLYDSFGFTCPRQMSTHVTNTLIIRVHIKIFMGNY